MRLVEAASAGTRQCTPVVQQASALLGWGMLVVQQASATLRRLSLVVSHISWSKICVVACSVPVPNTCAHMVMLSRHSCDQRQSSTCPAFEGVLASASRSSVGAGLETCKPPHMQRQQPRRFKRRD
jgi:hypothetical protein